MIEIDNLTIVNNMNLIDLPSGFNWWIKSDPTKITDSEIDGDRLIIHSLSKYDLDNFECVSDYGFRRTKYKQLKLDPMVYQSELNKFYEKTKNLRIVLLDELSEIRLGGRVFLKCTDEDGDYVRKHWLVDGLDMSRVRVTDDILKIDSIDQRDFGNYTCDYEDQYGERRLSFALNEELFKPKSTSDRNQMNEIKISANEESPSISNIIRNKFKQIIHDLRINADYDAETSQLTLQCATDLGNFFLIFFSSLIELK